jgi:hypothetical protein
LCTNTYGNQPLAALATPDLSLTMTYSWHAQSGLDIFLAQRYRLLCP